MQKTKIFIDLAGFIDNSSSLKGIIKSSARLHRVGNVAKIVMSSLSGTYEAKSTKLHSKVAGTSLITCEIEHDNCDAQILARSLDQAFRNAGRNDLVISRPLHSANEAESKQHIRLMVSKKL